VADASDYSSYRSSSSISVDPAWRRTTASGPRRKHASDIRSHRPGGALSDGDYVLTLRGVLANGDVDDVSRSLLRVSHN